MSTFTRSCCYFSSCLFLFAQCFHLSFLFLIWLHWLGHSVPHSLSKSLILDKCHWQVWRCSLVVEASLACTRLWFPGTMGVGSTASLQMFKNIYIYSLKKALSFSPSFFALQTFQFWEKTRLCRSGSPLTSALKWSSRALSLSLPPLLVTSCTTHSGCHSTLFWTDSSGATEAHTELCLVYHSSQKLPTTSGTRTILLGVSFTLGFILSLLGMVFCQ